MKLAHFFEFSSLQCDGVIRTNTSCVVSVISTVISTVVRSFFDFKDGPCKDRQEQRDVRTMAFLVYHPPFFPPHPQVYLRVQYTR